MKIDEVTTLKIMVSVALYVIYLMLSFILSGELAYRFAGEQMGIVAYVILIVLFACGTIIFVAGLLKLSKAKTKI